MSPEGALRGADPLVAESLGRALDGRAVSERGGAALLSAGGADAHLVGAVADELRRRRCGDDVTYVVNRNINFTNVCVKQCGFCAFSRDFREEEGYVLPVGEIASRAAEAQKMGATEVCVQAGLLPDMEPDLYERICAAIKKAAPGIHIHGFSPEEVLYGAQRAGVGVQEFVSRLKEAGVDTMPGTSAEILDQGVRDRISPGRISARDWKAVIGAAHRAGLKTTSTMMYGHVETGAQKIAHICAIRRMQEETGGFTEFVPLGFVHSEAPMRGMPGARPGPSARETLLTHAVSRIMLDGCIDNIQASWVKEGQAMTQVLLCWGANDLGGTLINESISTSAGSGHGQMMRPSGMERMAEAAGRRAVQRDTLYGRTGGGRAALEGAEPGAFGSYFELIKIKKYRYSSEQRKGEVRAVPRGQQGADRARHAAAAQH